MKLADQLFTLTHQLPLPNGPCTLSSTLEYVALIYSKQLYLISKEYDASTVPIKLINHDFDIENAYLYSTPIQGILGLLYSVKGSYMTSNIVGNIISERMSVPIPQGRIDHIAFYDNSPDIFCIIYQNGLLCTLPTYIFDGSS